MKKNKTISRVMFFALLIIAAIAVSGSVKTSAAIRYQVVPKDYSKVFKSGDNTINTECYVNQLKFKGDSDAVKKINGFLARLSKEIKPETINEYAKEDVKYSSSKTTYQDYLDMSVVYDNGKYVSVYTFRNWYAGGVGNSFERGYTFNYKTGQRVYITYATGLSLSKLKSMLIEQIKATDEFDDFSFEEVINKKTAADFSYYFIDANTIAVTFDPYELGWGGWSRTYQISLLPETPGLLVEGVKNKKSVKFTIPKTAKADGYRIFYKKTGDKDYRTITIKKNGNAVRSYTKKKLEAGTYSFYVKAYRKVNGKTFWSAESEKTKLKIK